MMQIQVVQNTKRWVLELKVFYLNFIKVFLWKFLGIENEQKIRKLLETDNRLKPYEYYIHRNIQIKRTYTRWR